MGEQIRLFDDDPVAAAQIAEIIAKQRPVARHGQPSTAWDAALAATRNAESDRWRVLDLFYDEPDLTNLEIEDRLRLKRPTGSNRRLDLEQLGLVERVTGQTRRMAGTQPSQVYKITPLGRAVYEHHLEEA